MAIAERARLPDPPSILPHSDNNFAPLSLSLSLSSCAIELRVAVPYFHSRKVFFSQRLAVVIMCYYVGWLFRWNILYVLFSRYLEGNCVPRAGIFVHLFKQYYTISVG